MDLSAGMNNSRNHYGYHYRMWNGDSAGRARLSSNVNNIICGEESPSI